MDNIQLIIILLSILLSAFFSGMEIAFISASKLHIELKSKQGIFSARALAIFVKNPSKFIATMLVGNTVALTVYGIFMAKALEPMIIQYLPALIQNDIAVLIIQTLLATLVILITAEFLPKSISLINPNSLLAFFTLPILFSYYTIYPLTFIIVSASKFVITKIFRMEYKSIRPVFGLTDLNNYIKNLRIDEEDDNVAEVDSRIFSNALDFKTVKVRECMIPRTELVAIDIEDASIEDLKSAFIESGFSKVLVYKENIDNIIGYCPSKEMFKKPDGIQRILLPLLITHETMLANELLIKLITEKKTLALVLDEFGGTAGIVTMEDIIEEIFGEIQDEHDGEELIEKKIDEQTYLLSARQEIDYLNEVYGWKIPDGEYDTLGGYILSETEEIPETNEVIDMDNFIVTIISKEDTRINMVKFHLKKSK